MHAVEKMTKMKRKGEKQLRVQEANAERIGWTTGYVDQYKARLQPLSLSPNCPSVSAA